MGKAPAVDIVSSPSRLCAFRVFPCSFACLWASHCQKTLSSRALVSLTIAVRGLHSPKSTTWVALSSNGSCSWLGHPSAASFLTRKGPSLLRDCWLRRLH